MRYRERGWVVAHFSISGKRPGVRTVILERYRRRKCTLVTSNRPLEDWGKLLGDNAAASAILDRLLHRGHRLKFEVKSCRLKEASKGLALGKKKN